MGKFTIFYMFENPRRGRQARNFTTYVPKIVDLKSCSEQIFFRKLSLGAPEPKTNFQAAAFKRPSERDVERKESSKSFGCAWVTAEFDFHTD